MQPERGERRVTKGMAGSPSSFESIRSWVVEHKLRTVGCLWLSGIGSSIAYNWSRPNMKTSVKIIHARLHAQALTLAALAGAAVVEYYDHQSKPRSNGDAGSGSRRRSQPRGDGQGVVEGLKCELCFKMCHKSKIKLAALVGITLSVLSLFVHLFVANYSVGDFIQYKLREDYLYPVGHKLRHRRLWGPVSSLEVLQPYAKPRSFYPVPGQQNGFIYAKISGGFEKIRSSICDLVAIARLLNATLVIPEIQQSVRSKGISPKFRSFSYLYDEEQFIASLSDDVIVVKSLPKDLKEARKKTKFPTVSPKASTSPSFYTREVLPKLKQSKVMRILVSDGGCLQPILPSNMDEYQRLRCRVAFHALQFRSEIQALGNQMVERLRGTGGPYLSYHPGFVRDTLAFHGCAELFQDVHTELIQYTRKQLIKQGTVDEDLVVDSFARKTNGSCPLIPEEVGLLLRAMGYPPNTIIYLAGSETFGGQRILVPLRAMYTNLVDRTSLCTKKELSNLIGPEYPLPSNLPQPPPVKSEKQLIEEWKKAGPRPRPLPPPPARPFYQHEKEGWYGWIAETDTEPDPSSMDIRKQAHRLLWDALDYYVSVEADAFFPGFNNDGSGWPDFSSLVMGHRSYQTASGVTYRPNRKTLVGLLSSMHDNLYHPTHNWTVLVRDHLNKSLGVDGFIAEAESSKTASFLSHPFPECSCRTSKSSDTPGHVMSRSGKLLYGNEEECPEWMVRGLAMASQKATGAKDEDVEEGELLEDDNETDGQSDSDNGNRSDTNRSMEQDEEMDPDD
ncbi:GDP-fucose protein O-fucosyltransferase [Musa troglodytarum]|uniref:O-fucosyltransferase family protein n=1 Tax=Musa troglodytarum TaxID=320322 RepID=A0A9E7KLJ0_9LILI|nr:GDP-fucose protein O-fucosyltransferase [Musa troglodytarum]